MQHPCRTLLGRLAGFTASMLHPAVRVAIMLQPVVRVELSFNGFQTSCCWMGLPGLLLSVRPKPTWCTGRRQVSWIPMGTRCRSS
jgi:hypothetical protein